MEWPSVIEAQVQPPKDSESFDGETNSLSEITQLGFSSDELSWSYLLKEIYTRGNPTRITGWKLT